MGQLWVDSDGVISNFPHQVQSLFGKTIQQMGSTEMLWQMINAEVRFWPTISVIEGSHAFIDKLRGTDFKVLTGCPKGEDGLVIPASAAAKKTWWWENFQIPNERVITCLSREKANFVINPTDTLVDDTYRNVKRFRAAGGRAILHRDFESTLEQLREMSYVV